MTQYFSSDPKVASNQFVIEIGFRGQTYSFVSDDGVFSKRQFDFGSRVLLEAMVDQLAGRVLDLGCGYGPIGILAGRTKRLDLTMVDVNPRAIELAKANALAHGVEADILVSDGFQKLTGPFDYILLNPPIRAGKAVIYQLFTDAYNYLAPGGQLVIVMRKKQGADSAKKKLQSIFGAVETIDRSGGYHVITAAKSTLADRNLTDHQEGQDDHESGVGDR